MVKALHKEDDIDMNYFEDLAQAAIDNISKYGDFDLFVSDTPYEKGMFESVPFDSPAGEKIAEEVAEGFMDLSELEENVA